LFFAGRGRPDEGIGPYGFTGELVTGEKRWNNMEVVPYRMNDSSVFDGRRRAQRCAPTPFMIS